MCGTMENDPIQNIIYDGIRKGIDACLAAECHRSALVLIYSAIDTMAYLSMGPGRQKVEKNDFIQWSERYLDIAGETVVTGLEWYSARCAILHNFGIESDLTRSKQSRKLGHADRCSPPIRFQQTVSSELVMVSIEALYDALRDGMNRFIIDMLANNGSRQLLEERLQNQLLASIPFPQT